MAKKLLFIFLVTVMLITACGGGPAVEPPDTGEEPAGEEPVGEEPAGEEPAEEVAVPVKDTMVIAVPGLGPGIDPNIQSSPQAWTIGAQIYGQQGMRWDQVPYENPGQTTADPNKVPGFWMAGPDMTKTTGGIIESCTIEADGSKATLVLREGVLSPYGNEFTTADIQYGLERSVDTGAIGNFFMGVGGAQDLAQWNFVDDYTAVVDQKEGKSLFNLCPLQSHIGAIGPWYMDSEETKKHATDDDPWAFNWVNEFGSWFGPYYVTDWVAGDQVVLEANPNWFGDELAIKKIIYKVVPESSNRIALLQAGEVDLIEGISPEEAAALDGVPGVVPIALKSNKQFFVVMDESKPPFSIVEVRQALNHSVNREAIVDSIYQGLGYPYEGILPVTFPGFVDPGNYPYDLDRARELLAEAGYPDGFETELSFAAGSPEEEQVAILWQADLRAIGIEVSLKKLPTAAISDLVFQKNANFAMWQDAPHIPDPVFGTLLWYASYSPAQFNKFNDPKVDDWVDECALIVDWPERIKCSQELGEYISSVAPLVNMVAPHFIYAVTDKVEGANFNYGQTYLVETMSFTE
jgi:peptide/nickel transport system substrate-binding protein